MALIKLKFTFIILILVALTNLMEAAKPGSLCTVATGSEDCEEALTFLMCVPYSTPGLDGGTCQCRPNTAYAGEVCKSILGASCNITVNDPQCDDTSFLICDPWHGDAVCVCQAGHEQITPQNKCRANLDDSCTGTSTLCDPSKFLSCSTSTKKCECRSGTILVNNVCVALLGESCDLPETPSCASDSRLICNGENKCECDANHAELDGQCTLQMNEACGQVGTICDPAKLLDCILSGLVPFPRCKCRDGTELIDNQCKAVVPPGVGLGKLCNATVGPFCIENSHLICGSESKVCECEPNHDPYGGKCKVNYQESCDSMVVCDLSQFLTCGSTGNCECRNGTQFFDGACRANINQTCSTIGLINPKCMDSDFLTCGSKSQCECRPGTTRVDDKCMAMVGQPCDEKEVANPKCDPEQQMACRNETCTCLEPFVDDGKGKCRVKFGGPCADDLPCDAGRLLQCNAGQCQCMANRMEVQGTCRGILNDQCEETGTERLCDGDKGLACKNQRCACLDDYIINEDLQTCSGAGGVLTSFGFTILVTLVMVVCWSFD